VTGRTLGNYQLLDPLGSGGMGQVYKARDTRLHRLVAIKVLREDLVASPSRKQRFIQEAKSASALNHPNIVTIYDIFQFEGMDCLVMEYIAGKTLGALIPRQGLPWKEALRIAVQVAEGLRRAHSAGIVHRDIKPSNVMVPDGGPVKILDFGLAKLTESQAPAVDDDTRTAGPVTEEGAVMGTVSYMSPEQAQGRPVDSRSDIFSFGSMLYEMLTGRRAFRQDSAAGTLAAILHGDPAPPASPGVPRALLRILFKCLQKKPEDRWQDMSDVKQLLEDVAKDSETPAEGLSSPQTASAGRARRFGWPAVAAACAAGALVAYTILRVLPATASSHAPVGAVLHRVTADSGLTGYPAISRDGKLLAYASDRAREDNLDIWLQQIGGRDPIRLTKDPADESDPAFSPDGTMIAFRSEKDGGGIFLVPALGGSPVLLAPLGRNPRFSPDGRWVAYSVGGEAVSNPGSAGVFIVNSSGGVPRAIHPEMATATNPVWSPGADRLLVSGRKDGKAPARAEIDWWILPIEGGTPHRTGAYARIDAQNLMKVPFSQVYPVALDWREAGGRGEAGEAGEKGDRILFSAFLGEAANLWEIPLLGSGVARRLTLGPGLHRHASWSADARRLIFAAEELNFDVWRQPLDPATGASSGPMQRLTDEATEELMPSISWDAGKIAYVSHRADNWSLRIRDTRSGTERTVLSSPARLPTASLSGDGTRILYSNVGYDLLSIPSAGGIVEKLCDRCGEVMGASTGGRQILYEPMENEDVLMYDSGRRATVKLALRTSPDLILSSSRFSPDGSWVAFHALRNATNSGRIWIAPTGPAVPAPQTEWIAVTDGAKLERDPAWSPDGRFLYFVSERDGFRCIWARPLTPLTKQPSGEAFAVRHFHSARFSLRHVGSRGFLTGLSVGEGALVFSMGELKGNVWLEENGR
jgi:Tol biopolymer transport system component/tRNA A-37 threonylcarbamoyl transferase component Bud32